MALVDFPLEVAFGQFRSVVALHGVTHTSAVLHPCLAGSLVVLFLSFLYRDSTVAGVFLEGGFLALHTLGEDCEVQGLAIKGLIPQFFGLSVLVGADNAPLLCVVLAERI